MRTPEGCAAKVFASSGLRRLSADSAESAGLGRGGSKGWTILCLSFEGDYLPIQQ
jgi:hypothetical protein